MRKRLVLSAIILLAVSSALAAQDIVPDVIKAQGTFSTDRLRQGSDFKLAVVLNIRKGFHANANVPTADFPTKIELDASPGLTFGKPQYPKPVMKSFVFSAEKLPVYEGRVVVMVPGKVDKNALLGSRVVTGRVSYQSCNEQSCYPPATVTFEVPAKVVKAGAAVKPAGQGIFAPKRTAAVSATKPQSQPVDKQTGELIAKIKKYGLPSVFVVGLLLCLTPCVFPMIPVIVGFFGAQGQGRKSRVSVLALFFVLGLALTYSVIGTTAALAGKGLGTALQQPIVPVILAGILAVLALSLFGLYEIPVPGFISSKSQGRAGVLGALVMGLVFGIVAAPCVGPGVLALLIVVGQMGDPVKGFLMFFALSLGLGTPFFFLALFSGALGRIPKPGIWMNAVRKLFGILLLGAAIYYVTPVLPARTARLAIPVFLIAVGFYWLLFERSTHRLRLVRPVQQLLGIAVIAFGSWSVYAASAPPIQWTPYTPQALHAAQAAHKPVVVDFTAAWCRPCEEMKATTFADPAVKKEADRFTRLVVDLTKTSKVSEKVRTDYKVVGPPTIVIIDSSGKERVRTIGYVSAREFAAKLKKVK